MVLSSDADVGTALGLVLLITAATLLAVGGVMLWRRLGAGIAARERITLDFATAGGIGLVSLTPEHAAFWDGTARGGVAIAIDPAEIVSVLGRDLDDRDDLDGLDDRADSLEEVGEVDVTAEIDARAVDPLPDACRADLPLPWEPVDPPMLDPPWQPPAAITPLPAVALGARSPLEQLRQRHDLIAAEAAAAFAEVHRLRVLALRQAREAERTAQQASAARAHASRVLEGDRRFATQGRVRPACLPAADDAYGTVHRLRTDALRQASKAEDLADRVGQARDRAARLLARQRELAFELRAFNR